MTDARASIEVILNLRAGAAARAAAVGEQISAALAAANLHATLAVAGSGEEVIRHAREAVARGARLVVAAGGDGTVSAVAGQVVGTAATLGVIPLGTLNHFAKDLRIPLELEAAVRTLAAGHETRVDVGEVNGRVFINNSSIGLYAHIVREREQLRQELGVGKWPAFAWAAWSVLKRHPFVDVSIFLANETLERRTPLVFIGNDEYEVEGLRLGRRKRLDAGMLCLYTLRRGGRAGLVALAVRALLHRLRSEVDFEFWCAPRITVSPRRETLQIACDGELVRMQAPLHYRSRPQALRVIVPAG